MSYLVEQTTFTEIGIITQDSLMLAEVFKGTLIHLPRVIQGRTLAG